MKAIVLYSGGLDSTLALALLQRLGIETIPLTFQLPFTRPRDIRPDAQPKGLQVVPLAGDYLELLRHPRHGRGKHLNPCVDCHLHMLQQARRLMPEWGADFVATGEVLGQRPMSQHRQSLDLISRESGLAGLLLRPLSAQLLEPTIPETKGWIPRSQLLGIRGRGRKIQFALAAEWGVREFGAPAGGCLMTDKSYCRRVERLIGAEMLTIPNMQWIRFGRFFDLGPEGKVMVARNQEECRALEELILPDDWVLRPGHGKGPTAILRGRRPEAVLPRAAAITAYYCRKHLPLQIMAARGSSDAGCVVSFEPIPENELRESLVS